MINLDVAVARLEVVLVVDPVAATRHTMWRLLNRFFGVIEACDAQGAREWLSTRPNIDALVVQADLPDARGGQLVKSLAGARVPAASRAVVVGRPADLRMVVTSLSRWFLLRDTRRAESLLREAQRLAS